MPYGVYLSASGAHAQSHRMQVLSNNLANVNTPGFKPEQTILQSRFAEMIEEGSVPSGLGGADDIGGGVTIKPSATQFAVGPMKRTGRELDFAINDESSFFVLEKGGETKLTRAGNFLFDSEGFMINPSGDKVMATGNTPIQIEAGKPYEIGSGGRVLQNGKTWEIMIAKPKSLGDLTHLGGNQFKPLAKFDLATRNERQVVAGTLEQSGVSPTGAMIELIETSRVYEANVRMIQNQDSVMGSLISRVLQS